MKNQILFIVFAMSLLFTMCKDDSDSTPTECTITGIKSKEGGQDQSTTINLKFDTQQRITKADYKYLSDTWSVAYDYQTDKIIKTEIINAQTDVSTYILSSGRVSKYTFGNTVIDFTYNSEGYLTKIINQTGSTNVVQDLTYTDGNLTQVTRKVNSAAAPIVTYQYTNELASNLLGYGNVLMLSDNTLEQAGDYFIVGAGYFGKASKNLPSSYQLTNSYNVTYQKDALGKIINMFKSTPGINLSTTFTYNCN